MATVNPFDLLGDNENDDPSQFVVAPLQKVAAKKPAAPGITAPTVAKLPVKPVPPAQAVRESREGRSNAAPPRGDAGGAGLGRGRGGRGPSREFGNENVNGFSRSYGIVGGGGGGGGEDGDADKPEKARPARHPFGGGRRGGYGGRGGYGNDESGGDDERPPRRLYERRSGTGRSYEVKRQGAGRGNWGTVADDALSQEKEDALKSYEKPTDGHQERENAPLTEESKDKEDAINETEEKEEDKEMTLEEYEKIKEEKRKALLALKAEERKVEIDKELQSMQLLTKKEMDPIFIKLGFDKDAGKKKENVDGDERSKKPLNINEFFMTGEGKQYYSSASRGRSRGRGDRAPFRGGFGGRGSSLIDAAPSIEDPSQFPMLSAK